VRIALIGLTALVVPLLVVAAPAPADIGIVKVEPTVARPGALVRVYVNGYVPLHAPAMPIVLVRSDLMPRPYTCRDGSTICEPIVWRRRLARPPYHVLGFATHWIRSRRLPDHADAILSAALPDVRAGRYTLALWCGPCVRGPQGSLIAGPRLTIR
jgi:hypothetical protein